MLRVETDSANIPPARNPNHCLEAVTLVLKHPGCTLGELVSLTLAEDEQGDEVAHEVARASLLPALQQAVMRGHLVSGDQRLCRDRGAITRTWWPDVVDFTLLAPPGLRGLAQLVHTAVARLAALEAQA
jgi:hypothetical protein